MLEENERLKFDDPKAMDSVAREKFDEIIEYLKENNKFDKIDVTLVEIFARAYSSYLTYYVTTIREGAVLTSDKGNKYINPANMIMQQSFNTLKALAKELGVGTLSRAKLDIQIQERDEFLDFLKKNDKKTTNK